MCLRFGVWGLGFRVQGGSGYMVQGGLGFRVVQGTVTFGCSGVGTPTPRELEQVPSGIILWGQY